MRHIPIQISVLTVRNTSNALYDVDVLDELAEKVTAGELLTVVRKIGLFGKQWVQDKEFHDFLSGTRMVQGFIYLAVAGLIAVCWFFVAKKRFKSIGRDLSSEDSSSASASSGFCHEA